MVYFETQYGFQYGPVTVERIFSDSKKGWVTLGIRTAKFAGHGLQVYVTKTGKIRIHDTRGEWTPPRKPPKRWHLKTKGKACRLNKKPSIP